MSPDKIVYMANQIATFFDSQRGPRMRAQLMDIVGAGGAGLSDTARRGAESLRETV
jgi:formate dehydrogenase subunit delta